MTNSFDTQLTEILFKVNHARLMAKPSELEIRDAVAQIKVLVREMIEKAKKKTAWGDYDINNWSDATNEFEEELLKALED